MGSASQTCHRWFHLLPLGVSVERLARKRRDFLAGSAAALSLAAPAVHAAGESRLGQSMAMVRGSLPAAKGEWLTGMSAPVVASTAYAEILPELSLAA